MYTGALENHPRLVERMARARTLWGNHAETLCRIRDPVRLAAKLRTERLDYLEVARDPSVLSDGRSGASWLLKPRRSAGGTRIVFCHDRLPGQLIPRGYYLQRYADGLACSAVYVAAGRSSVLLGITRQIIGAAWCGAGGFQYCGSIGPIELPTTAVAAATRLGEVLAARFNLCGLFGVDLVVNQQGVWPVEVNPRYTASCEILDMAGDGSLVARHVAACQSGRLRDPGTAGSGTIHGKAVLFATRPTVICDDLNDRPSLATSTTIRDAPARGTRIETGGPILTLVTGGRDHDDVLLRLRAGANQVREALHTGSDDRKSSEERPSTRRGR